MRHLKKFNESVSYYDKLRQSGDLSEIMHIIENSDILDEFPQMSINFFESSQGYCLDHALKYNYMTKEEVNYLKKNSFTVEIDENVSDIWDRKFIYYIEPKICEIIDDINIMLTSLGYKIVYNDFGSGDTSYELIITDISY